MCQANFSLPRKWRLLHPKMDFSREAFPIEQSASLDNAFSKDRIIRFRRFPDSNGGFIIRRFKGESQERKKKSPTRWVSGATGRRKKNFGKNSRRDARANELSAEHLNSQLFIKLSIFKPQFNLVLNTERTETVQLFTLMVLFKIPGECAPIKNYHERLSSLL